ncbi:GNAT family N-acetyltransferase [Thalassobacillus sp. CUG 92003]|uniref:GNAT family N-acetyltransferase n=1 Tax=Thalassobacillus sp. CUG 92003 TaxID=2736641 RepID=UPI0015E7B8C2|nr:GNAT family N-acetyltransferase [Thalassobacillus sp. CUG 92003]
MELSTDRLYMRPYTNHDEDFLMMMLSDPDMMRFIGNGQPKDSSGVKAFLDWIFQTYETDSTRDLHVVVRKRDHVRVGHAGLIPQHINGENEVEIGYWVASPFWGEGYATEAALALTKHGLETQREPRLIAIIQPGNKASIGVAAKTGMTFEQELVHQGNTVHLYAITTDTWDSE